MYPFLCLPRFTGISEKIGDVVSRLVAMPVIVPFEEVVQTVDETFFSAHVPDQSGYVLGSIPGVVVRSPFTDERSGGKRIEWLNPGSVGMAATGIACFGVDYVPVVFRPFDECFILVCLA